MPQATVAPKAEPAAASTYTPAQQAWLNFVAKVRRGEQIDPTGQYVKDGTRVPDDQQPHVRPKFDAARDKYPFVLLADGTVVPLAKTGAGGDNGSSFTDPRNDTPQPCPPGEPCPPSGYPPAVTSTFVSSVGLGGTGDIVDIKSLYDVQSILGYEKLNANLNQGAGGSDIYYHFTRFASSVIQGVEYSQPDQYPNLSTADPVVAYGGKTTHWFYQNVPDSDPDFAGIWYPNPDIDRGRWKPVDLNQGAGGEYVWTYQAKTLSVGNGAAPFHEIGIISGNSSQIQPPAGWGKYPQDLNDSAGGDFIYFCYKR